MHKSHTSATVTTTIHPHNLNTRHTTRQCIQQTLGDSVKANRAAHLSNCAEVCSTL